MRTANWREVSWSRLSQTWDVLIVGGGITGAGLLHETTRMGLRSLLVEQRDFAWGASSRSSKLIHGGLRYLKEGKWHLTWEAVRERERFLKQGGGLIAPVGFLFPIYKGSSPGAMMHQLVFTIADLFALRSNHQHYRAEAFYLLAPHIPRAGLTGGFRYGEAQVDDARLVLRVLGEAMSAGGSALNYVRAEQLLWRGDRVVGARLRDRERDRTADVYARIVINATGAWADQLREQAAGPARIRPLRGSHLVFPAWRVPLPQVVSWNHPWDRRPVFLQPWEGATLVGTTDSDYRRSLGEEPAIQPQEVAYLMAALEDQFPSLQLTPDDIIATFSGVRPVIAGGEANSSHEGRDHAVWSEKGLLTVTGGKMTTTRLMVEDVLKKAAPGEIRRSGPVRLLNRVANTTAPFHQANDAVVRRLRGRYGIAAPLLINMARPGELEPIPGTQTLWIELRWAAQAEGVVHLDDLLLRRVRLGLLLPNGGSAHLPAIRRLCQPELGWSDEKWEQEEEVYLALIHACYSLPDRSTIPDWHSAPKAARGDKREEP